MRASNLLAGGETEHSGQAIMEYAILIGVVTAAMLGMQLYAKRSLQAGIKTAADQLSPYPDDPNGERAQLDGMRYESGDRKTRVFAVGDAMVNESAARTVVHQVATTSTTTGGGVQRTTAVGDDTLTTHGVLPEDTRGPGATSYTEVIVDER